MRPGSKWHIMSLCQSLKIHNELRSGLMTFLLILFQRLFQVYIISFTKMSNISIKYNIMCILCCIYNIVLTKVDVLTLLIYGILKVPTSI